MQDERVLAPDDRKRTAVFLQMANRKDFYAAEGNATPSKTEHVQRPFREINFVFHTLHSKSALSKRLDIAADLVWLFSKFVVTVTEKAHVWKLH